MKSLNEEVERFRIEKENAQKIMRQKDQEKDEIIRKMSSQVKHLFCTSLLEYILFN